MKWALGYQLTPDNKDYLEHSVARVLFLHTFNLDLKDVADATEAENEIKWSNKRITKDSIVKLLRHDSNKMEEEKQKSTADDWWFCSGELFALQALNTFGVALVDLDQCFKYDDAVLDSPNMRAIRQLHHSSPTQTIRQVIRQLHRSALTQTIQRVIQQLHRSSSTQTSQHGRLKECGVDKSKVHQVLSMPL